MTTPQYLMDHPADETLAAFIDGRLSGDAHESVVEHVATCDECHAVWQSGAEFRESEIPEPENVVRGPFPGWVPMAAMAAAVAGMFAAGPIKAVFAHPAEIRQMIKVSQEFERRSFEPRLSIPFPFKPPKDRYRGGQDQDDPLQSLRMKDLALKMLERGGGDAQDVATAHFFLANWDDAVSVLETELTKETGAPTVNEAINASRNTKLLNDLVAAYWLRADHGGKQSDLDSALLASNRAWQLEKTPPIAFNRALVIQRRNPLGPEAIAAWKTYLSLDSTSGWADDARRELDTLQRY